MKTEQFLLTVKSSLYFKIYLNFAGLIGSGIFQFSQAQIHVFLTMAFVYIFYLTYLVITRPTAVIFAELCILLCYVVFVLKFM